MKTGRSILAKSYLFIILFLWLMASAGCGGGGGAEEPVPVHPEGWVEAHGAEFVALPADCESCHGEDLLGGTSETGCFSAGLDGVACHGAQAYHGAGWETPGGHGAAAKQAAGADAGLDSCRPCHGLDFSGGIIKVSCSASACHGTAGGVVAPHPSPPWRGAILTHTDTSRNNAPACALCHQGQSSSPAPPGTAPGCFNNALCHGTVWEAPSYPGHEMPFVDPALHGPLAEADLTICQICHASPPDGGPGSNPRFNVPTGRLSEGCELCHGIYRAHPGPWLGMDHRDAGNIPEACTLCHGPTLEEGPRMACSICHRAGSPLTSVGCTSCHGAPPSGDVSPDREGAHSEHMALPYLPSSCGTCHSGAGTGTAEHFNSTVEVAFPPEYSAPGGTASFDPGAGTCQNVSCHGGLPTPDWTTGSIEADCVMCHVLTPGGLASNGRHQAHIDAGFDCGKCHLGYAATGTHFNGTFDTGDPSVLLVLFDSTNPSGQWDDAAGRCSSLDCHGVDSLQWYGTGGWSLPTCVACHSEARGSRRPVAGPAGDFGTNTSMVSHHVAGDVNPDDAQCAACHDLSGHMQGEVLLRDADTGAVIAYDPAHPASAEPFCLGCHDDDGANGDYMPLADGQAISVEPYRMSAEIKTHWEKAYGHQRLGLTCLGSGEPGTGCHSNGHGSSFVGILARNLSLPNTNGGPYTAADEGSYDLCFHCHQSYPRVAKEAILGVRQSGNYDWNHGWSETPPYYLPDIMTAFRDRNENSPKPYDDEPLWAEYFNLHYFHLEDSIWNYRNITPSGVSCITCHNVHGSDTSPGWVYDEMQLRHYPGEGSDEYAVMEYADPDTLSYYPISCTFNCHRILGQTHMWFQPPNE